MQLIEVLHRANGYLRYPFITLANETRRMLVRGRLHLSMNALNFAKVSNRPDLY